MLMHRSHGFLRRWRRAWGMTQRQAAPLFGVSVTTFCQWERWQAFDEALEAMPETFGPKIRAGRKAATKPPGAVLVMLRLIEAHPEAAIEVWPDLGAKNRAAGEPVKVPPKVWALFEVRKRATYRREAPTRGLPVGIDVPVVALPVDH